MSVEAQRERLLHVVQGEFAIIDRPGVVLTTVLGSCVATCIWDSDASVGGMNHFLLPGDADAAGASMKYGVNAMELLINGLLRAGAARPRLQAKLFGGAHIVANLRDIGAQNAAFAIRFLELERIACVSQSLGGSKARRIRFWPSTGRAGQILLPSTHAELVEGTSVGVPALSAEAGSVELF